MFLVVTVNEMFCRISLCCFYDIHKHVYLFLYSVVSSVQDSTLHWETWRSGQLIYCPLDSLGKVQFQSLSIWLKCYVMLIGKVYWKKFNWPCYQSLLIHYDPSEWHHLLVYSVNQYPGIFRIMCWNCQYISVATWLINYIFSVFNM